MNDWSDRKRDVKGAYIRILKNPTTEPERYAERHTPTQMVLKII